MRAVSMGPVPLEVQMGGAHASGIVGGTQFMASEIGRSKLRPSQICQLPFVNIPKSKLSSFTFPCETRAAN